MIKKILIYSGFLISGIVIAVAFMTASTYTELAIATIFYPPLAYLAFKSLPVRQKKQPVTTEGLPVGETIEEGESDVDADKRAFLKIIGAAGISYFLYTIFNRKSEAMFFGKTAESGTNSIEDASGNKINPAERLPTDGYQITEISEDVDVYTGYTNQIGAWYIMKADSTTGSFRYIRGESNFPNSWSNRENLKYDYFYNVFNK